MNKNDINHGNESRSERKRTLSYSAGVVGCDGKITDGDADKGAGVVVGCPSPSKKELYGDSSPLQKIPQSRYPWLLKTCAQILEEMLRIKGFILGRPSDLKKLQHHVQFIVTNLYHCFQQDHGRWLSVSKDRVLYTKGKGWYAVKFNLSYDYTIKVLKFLLGKTPGSSFPLVDESPPLHIPGKIKASRMGGIRINSFMYEFYLQFYLDSSLRDPVADESLSPEELDPEWVSDYRGQELIVMKGLQPPKKKGARDHPPRKICKTPATPYVARLREKVEFINALLERTEITLDLPQKELKWLAGMLRNDPERSYGVLDTSRKTLHRSYCDRRLDHGGRWYGGFWQGIPKDFRKHILINSAPTVEPDYSGYHPRILYGLNGVLDKLAADPYRIEGYPNTPEMRSFLKPLLLMIVNSRSEQSCIGAIEGQREKVKKKDKRWGRETKPLGVKIEKYTQYQDVIRKLQAVHEPISNFFYSGKGIHVKDLHGRDVHLPNGLGLYLQNIDSEIAEAIMVSFAYHLGMAVLPVHDSFIVDFRVVNELEEYMLQITEMVFGQALPVKPVMAGVVQNIARADELLKADNLQYHAGTFLDLFKDTPERWELLRVLKMEAAQRVEEVRGTGKEIL
jgi:hypothetical protein